MVLQARMGSTRLPGKSMMPMCGEPLLYRILERVSRCKRVDEVVVAIPVSEQDNILIPVCEKAGVPVFRGSEEDCLDRYYHAAKQFSADYVIRLPADNATPEPEEIDRLVDYHLGLGRRGFSTNLIEIMGSGYPDGIGAEIFNFSLLEEAWEGNPNLRRREHVHLNFFDYEGEVAVDPEWCPIGTPKCPSAFARPDVILDVNTQEQYFFIKDLYEALYPENPNFHISDTLRWYNEWKSEKKI
jgi:spore coat polysaccharide biosynthesis protein SpsF